MLKIVKGNDFVLKLKVDRMTCLGGSIRSEPCQLSSASEVKVQFEHCLGKVLPRFDMCGNELRMYGKGDMHLGKYGLEIKAVDAAGTKLRYHSDSMFSIVNNTREACIPAEVEFDYNVYNLGIVGLYMGSGLSYRVVNDDTYNLTIK